MSLGLWLAFAATVIVLALSPGPGAAAVMSIGISRGFVAAFRVVLGLQVALLIQLGLVALGLGAILLASETIYFLVRLIGALYLIWLGIAKWRAQPHQQEDGGPVVLGQEFRHGLLVNLSNPKALVFMAALLPQFVDPGRPPWSQYVVIALTMCAIDTLVMGAYGKVAERLAGWLASREHQRSANRLFGAAFVALGLGLLLSTP